MALTEADDTMTDPTAEPGLAGVPQGVADEARSTIPLRLIGAGLAAGLAFAVLWASWVITGVIDPDGHFGLRVVLGSDGVAGGELSGLLIAWATGPIAAAAAGWLFAPSAAWFPGRAGANMGTATYLIAIAIAPLAAAPQALAPAAVGQADLVGAVSSVPALWFLSAFVLAPLDLVCVASGIVWARLLGRIRKRAAGPPPSRPPTILWAGILGSLLVVGFAFGFGLFSMISFAPAGVD